MAFVAFVTSILEYRLLAYRMTNITCRPMPACSEGIGAWQGVFECITVLATATNVGIMVFTMYPFQKMSRDKQLGLFIVLEHLLLLFGSTINLAIPDEPEDVQHINEFNVRFKRFFNGRGGCMSVPKSE